MIRLNPQRRSVLAHCRAVGALLCLGLAGIGLGVAQTKPDRIAVMVDIRGAIGPATTHFIQTAIEKAQERQAEVLILRLNTPGGLASSMRDIIGDILASPVPIVGYVAPSGAHAASAGTYIMYATHVAAMAPGTNLGAATPVQIGGGGLPGMPQPKKEGEEDKNGKNGGKDPSKPSSPMDAKAVSDAVAFIRSLAELRGRNAEWAEAAVREAKSLSANGALDAGVIEIVAEDLEGLLKALDGRTVTVGQQQRTLRTAGLTVETIEPGLVTRLLGILSNPNVAFILMLIGIYGLIFELANPGTLGPGLIGAIALLLALYALNQLPLNYTGVALILLGIGFMVAEAFTPTFGVLGLSGLAAFVIGAAMLIDTDIPAFQIDWSVIAGTAAVSAALLMLLLGYLWRSQRLAVASGREQLVGAPAEVIEWSGGEGHVWVHGERWRARGSGQFREGQTVRVEAMDGLTLTVSPAQAQAGADAGNKEPRHVG